jgi:hypothetical protein
VPLNFPSFSAIVVLLPFKLSTAAAGANNNAVGRTRSLIYIIIYM